MWKVAQSKRPVSNAKKKISAREKISEDDFLKSAVAQKSADKKESTKPISRRMRFLRIVAKSKGPLMKVMRYIAKLRPVAGSLRPTFVFAQWWDFETLHCPT